MKKQNKKNCQEKATYKLYILNWYKPKHICGLANIIYSIYKKKNINIKILSLDITHQWI